MIAALIPAWGILKMVFGFFVNSTAGKYLAIGLAGLVFIGWLRLDASAPYRAEIKQLQAAAEQKEAIIAADAKRAESAEKEKTRLEAEVKRIADEAAKRTDACKLSRADVDRLLQLSKSNR